MSTKPRVTGIGGIFFKSRDPKALAGWYAEHLGVAMEGSGEDEAQASTFHWREKDDPDSEGATVWALFPEDTAYFSPGTASFMVNYRVDDLDAVLASLRAEGVWVDDRREDHAYGRFAWIKDPEGNRIELWQPGSMP